MFSRTSPTGARPNAATANCFDNVQEEGFVFDADGALLEVNDALVRILGYDSREELLPIDIATELYFSPRHSQELAEELKRAGEMHNQEETLRRKDGTPGTGFHELLCVA